MNINQNNLGFLLFSCLSLSVNTLISKEADLILGAAIKRAYRDASSRVLSIKEKDPRNSESDKKNPEKIIATAICSLEAADDYDTWHCNLCNCLRETYCDCSYNTSKNGEELAFSFGIAQKWVNMTMKYMALLCDICSNSEFENSGFYQKYGKVIEKHRKSFHSPVDRYIINAAWDCSQVNLPLKVDCEKRSNMYKNPSDYVKAWSKWEEEEYCQFQKSLRTFLQGKYPDKTIMDWENEAWILEAERINKRPESKGNNND